MYIDYKKKLNNDQKKILNERKENINMQSFICVLSHSVMSDSSQSTDCSLPSSVHGIFQARILEWVAILFSRGSSQSRDGTPCLLHLLLWSVPPAKPNNIFNKG